MLPVISAPYAAGTRVIGNRVTAWTNATQPDFVGMVAPASHNALACTLTHDRRVSASPDQAALISSSSRCLDTVLKTPGRSGADLQLLAFDDPASKSFFL